MEYVFIAWCVLYVIWLISMLVMGTTRNLISFTVAFVFVPVFTVIVAFLAPLAVIFSKTAREAAKGEMGKDKS